MTSELRPGAQVYVPLEQVTPQKSPVVKVQCSATSQSSRYSRKTVRASSMTGDAPRPILGTKVPFPRAILGRKEYSTRDDDTYLTKEFRSLTRNMQQVKINDEKSTPKKTNSCSL
jgi:hypothetical protein